MQHALTNGGDQQRKALLQLLIADVQVATHNAGIRVGGAAGGRRQTLSLSTNSTALTHAPTRRSSRLNEPSDRT
jgi:hypothetical protein